MAVLKRAFRFVARLFAILVLAVSLPAVLIGIGLVIAHSRDHDKPCACPGQSSIGPVAVFTGQVHDVTGNSVIFDIDEVQRGTVTVGEPIEALGVEQFGQTGTIDDLYRHHGMDANAIIDAAESITVGAPIRHRKMAV